MKVGRKLYDFTGSKNPSSLGTNKDERVTYTLTIPQSGYYDNMVVTVEFDGLDFASGMPADGKWTDKRNGVYEYRPSSAGNTPLDLVSTISGVRTNKITFSAPGFTQYEPTIEQRDALTATINSTISGNCGGGFGERNNSFNVTITTSGADPYTATGKFNNNGFIYFTYEYSINIQNWVVKYADDNQLVYIELVYGNDKYTGTCTLRQILDGNVNNLNLN